MRSNLNARVCLLVDKTFPDGVTISAGSPGYIREIDQIFGGYVVEFDGESTPRLIADDELEAC